MSCACKGIRICLSCENEKKGLYRPNFDSSEDEYGYCFHCNRAYKTENPYEVSQNHPNHSEESLDIDGILLIPDFVTEIEEQDMIKNIDAVSWIPSQSGRMKQKDNKRDFGKESVVFNFILRQKDFGPKVNFKKKKVKIGNFCGFPPFVSFLVERFQKISILSNFIPVELCNLEYVPERGSSIDSHLDDSWLWGERLVTVNLLSNTVLTLSPVENPTKCSIHIPLYHRSLIVLYGSARYNWYHAIHRKFVDSRRLAMTFRELSVEFLPGGAEEKTGKELLTCVGYET